MDGSNGWRVVLRRWPSAVGLLAAAGLLATGADRGTLAVVVGVATLCYLGAAALAMPWVGWAGIPVAGVVVVASELVGVAWWAGVGVAALVLIVAGVLRRVPRPALTAQTAAMLGFGGLAVGALFIAPRVGLLLVAATLATHAVWDVVHFRRNRVVPRSLAEFCMLLDAPLGVVLVVVAVVG